MSLFIDDAHNLYPKTLTALVAKQSFHLAAPLQSPDGRIDKPEAQPVPQRPVTNHATAPARGKRGMEGQMPPDDAHRVDEGRSTSMARGVESRPSPYHPVQHPQMVLPLCCEARGTVIVD